MRTKREATRAYRLDCGHLLLRHTFVAGEKKAVLESLQGELELASEEGAVGFGDVLRRLHA